MNLEQIRSLALEELGSEQAADAFMEGFQKAALEKSASFSTVMAHPFWQHPLSKPVVGLTASLIGAGIVKGLATAGKAHESSNLRSRFELALSQVVSSNKYVKGSRPEKVKEFAETFFSFAPHVVADPNVLGNILSHALQGESVDVNTIKTLVDLESRLVDNKRTGPVPTFKA